MNSLFGNLIHLPVGQIDGTRHGAKLRSITNLKNPRLTLLLRYHGHFPYITPGDGGVRIPHSGWITCHYREAGYHRAGSDLR